MQRARGLVIRYGPRPAVSGVDLDLAPNEILGLLGPNGAGKSTLLRRLAGLLHAQSGSVDLDGSDPAADPATRAPIGYLPHDPPLYAEDTAPQHVTYLAAPAGPPREGGGDGGPARAAQRGAAQRARGPPGGRGGVPGGGPRRRRGHRRRGVRARLAAAGAGPGSRRPGGRLPRRRHPGAGPACEGRGKVSGALRIARRELRAYLVTPATYAVSVAFLALTGITFFVVTDGSREASLRFWFPNLGFVLLVSVPIITSRLVADEWRSRHLDVLLSRPVSAGGLVVGKWLAAVALVLRP